MNEKLLPFLLELRKRLWYCVISLFIIFLAALYFANDIYTALALPLLKQLPQGHGLIATNILSSFFVPFDLAFVVSFFIAMPVFLYQLWAFVAPALYQKERRLIWPLLTLSTFLFYLGTAFAYFVIFPVLFGFLSHTAPVGVTIAPDIGQYVDITLKLFFIFGLMFEIPILIILLIWTKVVSREQCIKIRPYAIVMAFVIGMLLAPPDVLSQTLIAVPLWLLFELGVFLARYI